ncbi:tonB-dependent receptor [Streptomyces laurentii]|uniref:TonB-dependent receptor n=1 Tax=Streptomyces laurentii TaxID=39478 RepID=A0A160P0A0_STRLU|nr:tonB-dependent receptor [Streptomyces laurentii]
MGWGEVGETHPTPPHPTPLSFLRQQLRGYHPDEGTVPTRLDLRVVAWHMLATTQAKQIGPRPGLAIPIEGLTTRKKTLPDGYPAP